MTYASLVEELPCFLDIGFEHERLTRRAVVDLVHIVAQAPENQTITENCVSGFNKNVLLNHRIIIPDSWKKANGKKPNEINDLRKPCRINNLRVGEVRKKPE
jgi:hypothetical protein